MKKILKLSLATIPTFIGIGVATSVGVIYSNKNKELNNKYLRLNQSIDGVDKNPFIQEAISKSLLYSKELLENLQTQILSHQQSISQSINEISSKLHEVSLKVSTIQNQIQLNQSELEKAHQEELRLTKEIDLLKETHTEIDRVSQLASSRAEAHQKVWSQDSLIKQLQTQLEESLKEKQSLEEMLVQAKMDYEHLTHESQFEIENYKAMIDELTNKIEHFRAQTPTAKIQTLYENNQIKINELNDRISKVIESSELLRFINDPRIILDWDKHNASKAHKDFMVSLFGESTGLNYEDSEYRDNKIMKFIKVSTTIFDFLQNRTTVTGEIDEWSILQEAIDKFIKDVNDQNMTPDGIIYINTPKMIVFLIKIMAIVSV